MHPSRKFFLPALLALSLSFPALAQVAGLQIIVSPVRQMRLADSIEAIGTLRANESAQLTASTTDTTPIPPMTKPHSPGRFSCRPEA